MSGGEDAGLAPTAPIEGLDVVRLDTLRDLDPGDTTYIDRAIGNFRVNSEEAVVAIREAVAAGEVAAVVARAHKIAGSALNLGCLRAGEAARAVEVAADEDGVGAAGLLLDELEESMAEGRALLRVYQATYAG